jgi:hypothetical protein
MREAFRLARATLRIYWPKGRISHSRQKACVAEGPASLMPF